MALYNLKILQNSSLIWDVLQFIIMDLLVEFVTTLLLEMHLMLLVMNWVMNMEEVCNILLLTSIKNLSLPLSLFSPS